MTAGTPHISSFAFSSIFHALHPSFSPPYVPPRIYYHLSATLLYLWCSRELIWTVKAAAVRANQATCKGLIHIDLQMNPDQRRLDKTCSPNAALHPSHQPLKLKMKANSLAAWGLSPATRGTVGQNKKLWGNTGYKPVRLDKKSSTVLQEKQAGVWGQRRRRTESKISSEEVLVAAVVAGGAAVFLLTVETLICADFLH